MRIALIDADTLVYEAARAHEVEVKWDDDLWTLHCEFDPARAQLDDTVADLMEKVKADEVVMALSDYTDPWRKRVMPTYKANRKDVRRPIVFRPLREYVHENYRTYQRPGLEGDDILGILLTHPKIIPGDKVVVSIDKDMKTLPGEHYRMRKGEHFTITTAEADYWHLYQALTGDSTDGYAGCPGIGPKSAAKLLDPFMDDDRKKFEDHFDVRGAWQAVVETYESKGLTEADALLNARVARICRHTDYDYTKKEVRLWTPPR